MLDFCEACERNKRPILQQLSRCFAGCSAVLEVGSGSGQHALYFTARLPHLRWYPSETGARFEVLTQNLREAPVANLQPPRELDMAALPWPAPGVDGVFSANTLHIVDWQRVEAFFAGAGQVLADGGVLAVYGPFRYGERHTSTGNAEFDRRLRARDPGSGIRDVAALDALALAQGFSSLEDCPLPANNRLLIWRRDG